MDGATIDLGSTPDGGALPDVPVVDDGTSSDAGPDSGVAVDLGGTDLGPPVDMSVGCTSAATCSDGLACNGVERCIAGSCSPGTPVACDDGIACSDDRCTEPAGACTFTRVDAHCPAGQTCTASTASGCATSSTCSESPCRLVTPQCGCAAGLACTISGTSRICGAAGTSTTGMPCTGGCATGTLCVTLGAAVGAPTACETFCNTDSDCTGLGALCIEMLNDGSGGTIPGVTLCTLSCNPLAGTGCVTGATCRVYTETGGAMRGLTQCSPVGAGAVGDMCTTADDCRAGMLCVDTTGGGTTHCANICNAGTGAGCGPLRTCGHFAPPIIVGTTEYGVCV